MPDKIPTCVIVVNRSNAAAQEDISPRQVSGLSDAFDLPAALPTGFPDGPDDLQPQDRHLAGVERS